MKTIIPSLIYEFEPSPRGRLALALVGFLFAVLLFFLDYKTGIELDFSVFFMVPILLMSWLLGFKTGLLFALLGETFDVIANIGWKSIFASRDFLLGCDSRSGSVSHFCGGYFASANID